MKAKIVKHFEVDGRRQCSATTENNIGLSFSVAIEEQIDLGDILEVDLENVVETQQVTRAASGKGIAVRLRENDIHDLNLPVVHGAMRTPAKERLAGGA